MSEMGFVRMELQGGFRAISQDPRRVAPKGKFRMIGIDSLTGDGWIEGDVRNLGRARRKANLLCDMIVSVHIFDEHGVHQDQAGIF
jgi:hypothetical protein